MLLVVLVIVEVVEQRVGTEAERLWGYLLLFCAGQAVAVDGVCVLDEPHYYILGQLDDILVCSVLRLCEEAVEVVVAESEEV